MRALGRTLLLHANLLLSVCAGVLYVTAFYLPGAWFVQFVSLVPLLIALERSRTYKDAFITGLPFVLVSMGGCTSFLLWSIPYAPLGPSLAALFTFGVYLSYVLVTLVLAGTLSLWPLLVFRLKTHALGSAGILAGAFVLLEYLRMHAFNLLTAAPLVENAPYFSFGFMGYPLADSSTWLQASVVGGVYALSLVAISVNLLVYEQMRGAQGGRMKTKRFVSACIILFVVTSMPIENVRKAVEQPPDSSVSVGIMSINVGPDGRYKRTSAYDEAVRDATQAVEKEGPDIILLPEAATLPEDGTHYQAGIIGTYIVPSYAVRPLSGVFLQSAGTTTKSHVRTKAVLAAQGEYVVSLYTALLSLFVTNRAGSALIGGSGYRTGSFSHELTLASGVRASVLLCLEAFTPLIGGRLVGEQQSEVLLVLMSHHSFQRHWGLRTDTRRALKVQAVSAGVPLVASADYAIAYALDRYGNIMETFGEHGTEFGTVVVPVRTSP